MVHLAPPPRGGDKGSWGNSALPGTTVVPRTVPGMNYGTSRQAQGGGVLMIMHGRSRKTIDPRIPTMPGRSTSGFHRQADTASTKREAPGGVRRVARSVSCILPRTACEEDFLAYA